MMTAFDRHSILGAVLAGGRSSRFGSDKALATLADERLLDHAMDWLGKRCGATILVGRADARHCGVPDWPKPDRGPLGGLAGALRHGRALGLPFVLSCAVDSIALPDDLPERLWPAPACVEAQPVIGLWPVAALPQLEAILLGTGKHSVHQFATAIGTRMVALPQAPANLNRPEDLDRLRGAPH